MKRDGGWMSSEFVDRYLVLHVLGYAHSVGAYKEDKLCGGLFGIGNGNFYTGDSMFRNISEHGEKFTQNASKASLVGLSRLLSKENGLIDCQYHSDLFESLGGKLIHHSEFQKLVQKNITGSVFSQI